MAEPHPKPADDSALETESMSAAPDGTLAVPVLTAGTVLAGRFTILRFIARGGMGEVYEATDAHLQNKHLALKTLRPEIGDDPIARQRFEREVLIAREVHHPNVCPTYDIFHEDGANGTFLFLTMKLFAGKTLRTLLNERGPISSDEALPLLRQMSAGLDAAHAAGIVHRDFKPSNVIVDSGQNPPHVTITDFGISRLLASGNTLSGSGHLAGTVGYIAPELYRGAAPTPASDVYSLGVVLRETVADPPKSWEAVIRKCLDDDPRQRPQRAGEAVALLNPAQSPQVSRRRMLAWSAAPAAASATAWYAWPAIDSRLHPLPAPRFVALMAWPPGQESQERGLLRTILEGIESRLVRAETNAHDLLLISAADPRRSAAVDKLADVPGSLGANLVLAASLTSQASRYHFGLQVLDAATSKTYRSGQFDSAGSAVNTLLDRAYALAAKLLDVPVVHAASSDDDELAKLPARALREYTEAEDLVGQPNDQGLDAAIEKYQKALEAEPRFAMGYAQLSRAYTRKYQLTRNTAALSMAGRNAELARRSDSSSNKAKFSSALVSIYSGKTSDALELLDSLLRSDPVNPLYAYTKARALRDLGRRSEEQSAYRDIIRNRPNYWPAHNELGWCLYRDGKIDEALKSFDEASQIAPRAALPLANLGTMYLEKGRKAEAAEAFKQSIERAPTDVAYLNLGSLEFEKHEYRKALASYEKARDLKPRDDTVWRNIADCQRMIGNQSAAQEAYGKAAEVSAELVQTNPKLGRVWMPLAFYYAKLGRRRDADAALLRAEQNGATDVASQFLKAQTLAVTGRHEQAVQLILELLKRGLARVEVEWALDLDGVRADTRYKNATEGKTG